MILVNASADRAWGDFPLSPAFAPLVHQIVRWSAEQIEGPEGFVAGDPVPYAPAVPRGEKGLALALPDGTTRALAPDERALALDRAEQAGFYEVTLPGRGALQAFAVNTDPRESSLRAISAAALDRIAPRETVCGLDELKLRLGRDEGMVPLWPFLLALAGLAFAAETILSNALARNRSQAEEKHIQTGRLNQRRTGMPFRPEGAEAAHDKTLALSKL